MAIKKVGGAKAPSAAAPLQEIDAEVMATRRKNRRMILAYTALWSALYYGFGMAYYCTRARKANAEGDMVHWTVVDSIYFATVTMTTTGYGDLKPHDTETRYVTVFYLLFGLLITFPAIATTLAPYYSRLDYALYSVTERFLRKYVGKIAENKLVDIDGDGLADYEQPPGPFIFYLKGVSSWLFLWIMSQVLFAIGYIYIDTSAEWDFDTAFYVCIVTATTVGYGDIGVSDEDGPKLFACFHILYSVSSLAALLNTVTELQSERRVMLRKGNLLQRQLDVDLIQSLDKDNNGLDKLEFIVRPRASSPPQPARRPPARQARPWSSEHCERACTMHASLLARVQSVQPVQLRPVCSARHTRAASLRWACSRSSRSSSGTTSSLS